MQWAGHYGRSPVLALDTSTHVASVAVLGPACDVSAEGRAAARSDDLISLIDRVLAEAGAALGDLAGVAAGPGSFTGLRIGMATAKGLCFAAGLPLWSVSSLAALALDAAAVEPLDGALVVPAIDARRGEICAGFYCVAGDRVESLAGECIMAASRLAVAVADLRRTARGAQLVGVVLVGDALVAHGATLAAAGQPLARARMTPSARSIARLALSGPRGDVLRSGTPVYLQPSAAEVAFPDGNPGTSLTAVPTRKQ